MKKYIDLIRVKHWIKNGLIFIPIISANAINYNNAINTIIAFLTFSFMSSVIYIINDIKDIEKDKTHPRKKNRPLASGLIEKKVALIIAIFIFFISILFNYFSTGTVFNYSLLILISYMLINLFYSLGLKNIAILDVFLLATGFVLRVYYGASVIGVPVSGFLFLTIINASLFLGLGKRKKELLNNKESRSVLRSYNESFLDKFQYICLGMTIIFYSLWAMEQTNSLIIFTIPLVMMIFMKYSLIIEKTSDGDPTTILYTDKILMALCVLYGLIMAILIVRF